MVEPIGLRKIQLLSEVICDVTVMQKLVKICVEFHLKFLARHLKVSTS